MIELLIMWICELLSKLFLVSHLSSYNAHFWAIEIYCTAFNGSFVIFFLLSFFCELYSHRFANSRLSLFVRSFVCLFHTFYYLNKIIFRWKNHLRRGCWGKIKTRLLLHLMMKFPFSIFSGFVSVLGWFGLDFYQNRTTIAKKKETAWLLRNEIMTKNELDIVSLCVMESKLDLDFSFFHFSPSKRNFIRLNHFQLSLISKLN